MDGGCGFTPVSGTPVGAENSREWCHNSMVLILRSKQGWHGVRGDPFFICAIAQKHLSLCFLGGALTFGSCRSSTEVADVANLPRSSTGGILDVFFTHCGGKFAKVSFVVFHGNYPNQQTWCVHVVEILEQ